LLGEHPTSLSQSLSTTGIIPSADGVVAVGLPSDLLLRRPDLRRAERNVHAATARIGVVESDLYPKFSLTGAFGLQSKDLADLPEGNSRFWNIGPSARWNVFDAGRIRRRIDAAGEREKQALVTFEQTVLTALEEVENALVTLDQERDRARYLREAVDAGNRAVALSDERYRSGVGDFLDVLESQRRLYDNEDQLVQSSSSATRAVISLYKSLGGGWQQAPESVAETLNETPASEPADPGTHAGD
jgi:NodT family efflux transporter outer membrane factor (OMF) lipoprotein